MATESSSLIVTTRIVLVLLAGAVATTGFVLGHREDSAPAASAEAHVVYVCPMHPKVVSQTPGDCPICRMALEPKTSSTEAAVKPAPPTATVSLPASAEFRAFDAVSLTKPYAIALEMRAAAWAEDTGQGSAIFYRDEAELLQPGEEGAFLPSKPDENGKLTETAVRVNAEPTLPWDDRTVRVRFTTSNGVLRRGQVGSLKFASRIRTGLVVRSSAILQSPEGPYVFVVSDDRRIMTKRRIQVGNLLYGYAAVTSGLREGESVAAKYVSSLDAELRQKGQVQL